MNILLRRRKLGHGSCNGIKAASQKGIGVLRNDAPFPSDLTYVFRWGCTSTIPQREGVTVVNSAASIHWCSNKKQGRLDMQAAGVSVPRTWSDPDSFEQDAEPGQQYVVRPSAHAQGRNLFAGGWQDSITAWHRFGGGYISELINKVAEYRVAVCQNRVVWVAKKTPGNPDQVAWNVAQGGRFDNVRWGDWPMRVVKEALKAAKVSGTDFCGVDVMVTEDGTPYVLEVNSAPSQTSEYRQKCFAKAFDHIVEHGKGHFPERDYPSWKSAIHPALIQE